MYIEYLKFFGIGIFTGTITTMLGIGGGVLILPILTYIMNVEWKTATAISTIQITFASSFGTLFKWLQKSINFRYAIIFGVSTGITRFFGSYFTDKIPGLTIKIIYLAAVLLALGLFFIKKNGSDDEMSEELAVRKVPTKADYFKIIPIGLIAGFALGILGIGGGFLYVPLLILLFDLPLKIAIGTSLMVVLFNAAPGLAGKLLSVQFDIWIGVAVAIGAIAGSRIGTYLSKKLKVKVIRIIFIILLVIIIGRLAWDLYGSFTGGGSAALH